MSGSNNTLSGRKFRFWFFIVAALTFSSLLLLLGCSQTNLISQLPHEAAGTWTLPPVLPAATPTLNFNFDFKTIIRDMEKAMPGPHTEGFKIPNKLDEQSFQKIVVSILKEDPLPAAKSAAAYNYELLPLFDLGEFGAESYVLSEKQPVERGWGLYFFRKQAAHDIIIEAPHPVADEDTSEVALDLYRALEAKALLIAGTHRDANTDGSADPAHAAESIFQTVHITLFRPDGQPDTRIIFLQIHGYAAEDHEGYPEVVIGYNWMNDPEKDLILSKIVTALQKNNLTVGTCNEKGFNGLCGTLNLQRQAANGGIFIHMELSAALRAHDQALITALQQALVP
jgi:hypothetical protein